MNYLELQLLFEAHLRKMWYEEKQKQLASQYSCAKQWRAPWMGVLSTLGVLCIIIWRLL